jgi:hypothetical protein
MQEERTIESLQASEERAWNVVETIRAARLREAGAIQAINNALRDAIPLLVRLGDFIGNAENRCEVILRAKDALREFEATLTETSKPLGPMKWESKQ